MKRKAFTHTQHLDHAGRVRELREEIVALEHEVSKNFARGSLECKAAENLRYAVSLYASTMDAHYHSVSSAKQFRDAGHVYYGLQAAPGESKEITHAGECGRLQGSVFGKSPTYIKQFSEHMQAFTPDEEKTT